MLDDGNSEERGMRELLCAIAAAYDKIDVVHGKFERPFGSLCFHYLYFSQYHALILMRTIVKSIFNLLY